MSFRRRILIPYVMPLSMVVLIAAKCPVGGGPTEPVFDGSTHHQIWRITLTDQLKQTVQFDAGATIGSTGIGTFDTQRAWSMDANGCAVPVQLSTGNIGRGSMSFSLNGANCNAKVQGAATGQLNGNSADNSTRANGSLRLNCTVILSGREQSCSSDVTWVAVKQ